MRFVIPVYTGLGNLILKTPLFKQIVQIYPNAEIFLIAENESIKELLPIDLMNISVEVQSSSGNFFIKLVSTVILLSRIRAATVLLPFDSTPIFFYTAATLVRFERKITHIKRLHGFKSLSQKLFFILFHKFETVSVIKNRHEIDLNIDLLSEHEAKPFYYSKRTELKNFGN